MSVSDQRLRGERRCYYDRAAKTVKVGRRVWQLKDTPPHVMYEWIRENRVFKGLVEDWLAEKVAAGKTD